MVKIKGATINNHTNYHYKVLDIEDKIHYFFTIEHLREHFKDASKKFIYSFISDKPYNVIKKEKFKSMDIIKIERVNIPKIKFTYILPESNEILH